MLRSRYSRGDGVIPLSAILAFVFGIEVEFA